jgi:hypothetical protein
VLHGEQRYQSQVDEQRGADGPIRRPIQSVRNEEAAEKTEAVQKYAEGQCVTQYAVDEDSNAGHDASCRMPEKPPTG